MKRQEIVIMRRERERERERDSERETERREMCKSFKMMITEQMKEIVIQDVMEIPLS
jgi:hypothetical protein